MISRRNVLGALVSGGAIAAATGGIQATASESKEAEKPKDAPVSFKFGLRSAKEKVFEGGSIREHHVSDFPASHNMSGTIAIVKVGGFREPHWHPEADEWAYVQQGKVRLTVVGLRGQVTTEDFEFGDTWFIPVGFGHTFVNTGDEEVELLVVHNFGKSTTIELSEWVSGGPKEVYAAVLGVPDEALDKVPKKKVTLGRKRKK